MAPDTSTQSQELMEELVPHPLPSYRSRRALVPLLVVAGAILGSILLATSTSSLQYPTDHVTEKTKKDVVHAAYHLGPQSEQSIPWEFVVANNKTNNPAYFYRNRSQVVHEFNSTVQFIFTVGLEGTGHHLMGTISTKSPAVQRLQNFKIWNEMIGSLRKLLFNDPSQKAHLPVGIWNAHCLPNKQSLQLEDSIVQKLRGIEQRANQAIAEYQKTSNTKTSTKRTTLPLPLNTAVVTNGGRFGQVSYPNYLGTCRPLNYPDLNLLYNACRKAKVDCLQVYIYRHPLEILNSISRRGFGKIDTASMQMYIADMHVMANQLQMYAAKTLGCFGFFSDDPADVYWVDAQKDLWAWEDVKDFKSFMTSIYKEPHHENITMEEKLQQFLGHSKHGPFVRSWMNVHDHTLQVCRQAVLAKL